MLSNMATSLIMHKRISTTVAKAKALRKYIEPLITRAKDDSTHSRRMVFSYLQDKVAVTELFREISQKIGDRPGGYTRILRTGFRIGDAAEMCMIELVDYNENYTQNKGGKKAKAKSTRRGRTRSKGETVETIETVKTETPVIEETSATIEAEIVEETSVPEEVVEETPALENTVATEAEIVEDTPVPEEVEEETDLENTEATEAEIVEETPAVEEVATTEEVPTEEKE
jgi:large subunit ribosomal protein L17